MFQNINILIPKLQTWSRLFAGSITFTFIGMFCCSLIEKIRKVHFLITISKLTLARQGWANMLLKATPFMPKGWTILKTEVIIIIITINILIVNLVQEDGPEMIVSASGDQFESWESALHCLRALGRGQQLLRAVRR